MTNTRNDILKSVNGLEKLAEESNDASIVRGAYKLIKQIEEFAQLLPAERATAASRAEASESTGTARKGKPGRKPGRKKGTKTKAASGSATEGATGPKRRGRKPKEVQPAVTETAETAE